MRINDRNLTGTSASETGRAQETKDLSRAGTGKANTGGVDGSNDRVAFSRTLTRLSRALTTFESSRARRVQALAANYQSGSYKPNALTTATCVCAAAMLAGLQ